MNQLEALVDSLKAQLRDALREKAYAEEAVGQVSAEVSEQAQANARAAYGFNRALSSCPLLSNIRYDTDPDGKTILIVGGEKLDARECSGGFRK